MTHPASEPLTVVAPADLPGLTAAPLLDAGGGIGRPLLAVDLDGPADRAVAALAADVAAAGDHVVIGIAREGVPDPGWDELVRALDVTLVPAGRGSAGREFVGVPDPVRAAEELAAAIGRHPAAATVLAGLLRWSGTLTVRAALDAESLAYSSLLGGPEFRGWLERRGPRPLPPPAVGDAVRVVREADVLHVTLNRPERRNAYGRELRDALVAALQVAEADPTLRVVVDGAGPVFCAGGDLDEFGRTPDPVTAHLVRTRAGAARPLARLAGRVEVRLHGTCVGAGIELPAYAGRVVAAPDTRLVLPEVGMGLIPGAGGTVSIPRRIGRWRTLWLAVSGAHLDAATALDWGLVDELPTTD